MDDRFDPPATTSPSPAPTNRRHFCGSLAALALGAALPACGGGSSPTGPSGSSNLPVLTGTPSGNAITVAVDSVAAGSAAIVTGGNAAILIARTGADTFTAFSATCTHEACTITNWSAPNFLCPCHGSMFGTAGQVVRGPATRALTQFATSLAGNTLTITG
jgi:cytochrome b6-f complex iron-sulfur subunit